MNTPHTGLATQRLRPPPPGERRRRRRLQRRAAAAAHLRLPGHRPLRVPGPRPVHQAPRQEDPCVILLLRRRRRSLHAEQEARRRRRRERPQRVLRGGGGFTPGGTDAPALQGPRHRAAGAARGSSRGSSRNTRKHRRHQHQRRGSSRIATTTAPPARTAAAGMDRPPLRPGPRGLLRRGACDAPRWAGAAPGEARGPPHARHRGGRAPAADAVKEAVERCWGNKAKRPKCHVLIDRSRSRIAVRCVPFLLSLYELRTPRKDRLRLIERVGDHRFPFKRAKPAASSCAA